MGSPFNLPNVNVVLSNMLSEWGEIPYAELSIVLVHLRSLALIHQNNHWTARGDSFYSDHGLFERLYNEIVPEIDAVAEKAVGLGNENNVNLNLQIIQTLKLVQTNNTTTMIPASNQLVVNSLVAETNFLTVIDYLLTSMKNKRTTTSGIENLLQDISDKHEGHVYILKQRSKR